MLDLTKQIEKWCNEYNLIPTDINVEYKWIDSHTIGITFFHTDPVYHSRWNKIHITNVFKDYELASKAVLWHEFCHAEVWLKDGKTDGHGSAWNGRLWRKPILYILDKVYTSILFTIIK